MTAPVSALLILWGLCWGSFLNVLIHRIPLRLKMNWQLEALEFFSGCTACVERYTVTPVAAWWQGRSHCPQCQHLLYWWNNIPVLSFCWQRGRCQHCQCAISWRYLLIELLASALTVYCYAHWGLNWTMWAWWTFGSVLLVLSAIDLEHTLLPDELTLGLMWLGFLFRLSPDGLPSQFLWGAIGGYGLLWSLYWIFKILTGKEGMGYGDFKLSAALGAWLGWEALLWIWLFSSWMGVLMVVIRGVFKPGSWQEPLPYGPLLALAAWGIVCLG